MKKVHFLSMLTAAALMVGITSCNNEDGINGGGGELKGERTSMQFVIKAPKAPTTYAPVDANAVQAEIDLYTVDVLIYEKTGAGYQLEQDAVHLVLADFEAVAGTDRYALKSTSKIATTTGDKKIFVAMNMPTSGVTFPAKGTPISDLNTLEATLSTGGDLSSATAGFAMFSTKATDASLVPETDATYATANKKTITVKRLVAKVTVQEDAGLSLLPSQGGWLTGLQFTLGNLNKSEYLLQNLVGSPTAVVHSPNWSAATPYTNFFTLTPTSPWPSTDYKAVDANGTAVASRTAMYAPENTVQTYETDGSNLTYVSVRAQYVPANFCDAAGASKGANTSATTPVSFWTVMLTNGTLYYFDVEAEADTFAALPANTGSVKNGEYIAGICYWRAYLNRAGNPDATITGSTAPDATITGSTAAHFDVLRNVYYQGTIKSIKAPGAPVDEGDVTEPTSLNLEVDVQPWETVNDTWDL